ncbi:NADP-dependent oxidoreductase [Aliifodinibius salipaludis]|uniref:NADP-dependent oxidoreductase n=1 Tax=Fodinibius salipaludis TaxID=2032627 RepID=A0A2A2GCN9_9BACT|nr:NADP-dependent oxidoreductase [Aliifodinibius salipaludis]PAU95321.1 NADP-dependent oxidoreductase [Aliifodinibius salipaludis]
MNTVITLANRPEGRPKTSDFNFETEKKPSPQEGEVLLETKYVSVDPYMRGRMSDAESYVAPFELGKPIEGGIVAKVVESKKENLTEGDYVSGRLDWKEYQVSDGEGLMKVDPEAAPLSAYLGILGMTGLTAYMGLLEIGKPKEGETLVVSGAAGAVGSVVGQIGKIKGCRVVGIAGSDEKVELLKSKFGFDGGINYKTTEDMGAVIAEACPNGVDIYFDNVAGEISDGVHQHINQFGRIVNCGAIAHYNATSMPMGPRVEPMLIKKSALMQGFIVGNYEEKFPEAVKQLAQWLGEGKLEHSETIVEGFDNIPQAFLDLFDGKNKGKMVVQV